MSIEGSHQDLGASAFTRLSGRHTGTFIHLGDDHNPFCTVDLDTKRDGPFSPNHLARLLHGHLDVLRPDPGHHTATS
jgi:hypothetical protein